MVNTYAVQSGGGRFEYLWGFGFSLKGAHYEVDYSGKKTYLAGLQCTLTSSCAKNEGALVKKSHNGEKKLKGGPFSLVQFSCNAKKGTALNVQFSGPKGTIWRLLKIS